MKRLLSKSKSKFLYWFLASHLVAYLSLLIIPAHAITRNASDLFLLNTVFIILVTVFFIITSKLFRINTRVNKLKNITAKQLVFNIKFVSICSISGFILMFYDRVFIRGINYSLGLRQARYQWLDSTGGSLYSVIGNLLIPFGYIALFLLVFHGNNMRRKDKAILIISSAISVFGHAALNGGRSNILIAVVFMVIISVIKNIFIGKPPKRKHYSFRKILILLLVMGYIFNITLSSAEMGRVSIQKLTELGIESVYGIPNESFYDMNGGNSILFLIIYSLVYLFHGQWTAEVTFSLPIRNGNYTFYTFIVILRSLGFPISNIEQGYFAKTGAFISLPGAFYYDFGYIGVVLLSIILGVLFAVAVLILHKSRVVSPSKLGFVIYVLFVVFLSPVLPGYGFMYLNFILAAFISIDILNRLIFREKVSFLTRNHIKMELE